MKTVLIGFGDIGPKHLEVLKNNNCDVVGLITKNKEKALSGLKVEAKCVSYSNPPVADIRIRIISDILPVFHRDRISIVTADDAKTRGKQRVTMSSACGVVTRSELKINSKRRECDPAELKR